MTWRADLHVHSRHSLATSKNSSLDEYAAQAARKGIRVIGTADFTHPEHFAELERRLVRAEAGFYILKEDADRPPGRDGVWTAARFVVSGEISTVYRQGDRTRKVHTLVLCPSIEAASELRKKLSGFRLGSDGRPTLPISAADLAARVFSVSPDFLLIPAHVWTPWYSLFGSRSGFDSLEDCFGDLAVKIRAIETGLSSDPAMNARISDLDRLSLVSFSDAHSPEKLGREATVFDADFSYPGLLAALRTGEGIRETIEFFPEEGKYHLDGHRDCGFSCEPQRSRDLDGLCPFCGGRLVHGVAHRVEELADRRVEDGRLLARPCRHAVPLRELLAEILNRGPGSKTVAEEQRRLIAALGPELDILLELPLDAIAAENAPLAEAIGNVRRGAVSVEAGYDGRYGKVRARLEEMEEEK